MVWWLWACTGEPSTQALDTDVSTQDTDVPTEDTDPPPSEGIEPAWEAGILPLFEVRCAPCHFGYDFGDLSLEQPSDFVGVASSRGMLLVTSGDLEASYLWHKVNDTQEEVGGAGERMPYEVAPLTAEELEAVATWIELGTP